MWERWLTPTSRSATEPVSLGHSAHWGSSHTLPHASCLSRFKCKTHTSIFFFACLPKGRYPKLTFPITAAFNIVTLLRSPALCSPLRLGKQKTKRKTRESWVKGSHSPPPAYKPFSLDSVLEAAFTPTCFLQSLGQTACTSKYTFQQESNSSQFFPTLAVETNIATLFIQWLNIKTVLKTMFSLPSSLPYNCS